uniref:Ig-like domain-containing protein n=1 Tax=Dicentrarchus labrax TaxID=13489 RepID=A0A8C4INX2_DICLA
MTDPLSCSTQLTSASGVLSGPHSGEARVLTEAQAGPLYRVVGYPLFISCNVSGFANADAKQEFEYRITKPANPNIEINIISTTDQTFGYAMYSQRVRKKEITLTNMSSTSVIFKIDSLQKSDEGEFDCTAINSEDRFDGTYSAKTTVKVIDNSLSVSSPASASLSYNEGDALTLTCQASSNTVQHTHLSLAWYLHKDSEDEAQPIISVNRDFTLSPGRGFEERYQAGLIRLDKIGEATYKLKMAQLELSDQGRIYCQAQEWIQDPDRSWYSIVQKAAEKSTLTVVPDTSSLVVRILAQPTTLQEGQELSLSCTIDAQNLREKFFSVAWLKESVELARIGPSGIVSVGPEYSVRAKEGELRLDEVTPSDSGVYQCTVSEWKINSKTNSQSQTAAVTVTPAGKICLRLSVRNNMVTVGGNLELMCRVKGPRVPITVTWSLQRGSSPDNILNPSASSRYAVTWHLQQKAENKTIISSNRDALITFEHVEPSQRQRINMKRSEGPSFELNIGQAQMSDRGTYICEVVEWLQDPRGDWIQLSTVSKSTTLTVIDKVLKPTIKKAVGLTPSQQMTSCFIN